MPRVELKTLHLSQPFRIAHGSSSTRQVVRLHEGESSAEAPFVPYYGEDPEATLRCLRALPDIHSPLPPEASRAARLVLDLLRNDLACRAQDEPLASLGPVTLPRRQGPIPACRSFSIPTDLDAFARLVAEIAQQFQVLKLKLGSGDLNHDEQIVRTARLAAPKAHIMADVNGGWTLAEACLLMPKLEKHGLILLEQPIHHRHGWEAWRSLRAALPGFSTPLFADESGQSADDVSILADWVEGINVKLLKGGSFEASVAMIAAARRHGRGVLLGCMIESSLGITAAAHLASWADWVDLDGHLYLADDDYSGLRFDDCGNLIMPSGAGIGAKPRRL